MKTRCSGPNFDFCVSLLRPRLAGQSGISLLWSGGLDDPVGESEDFLKFSPVCRRREKLKCPTVPPDACRADVLVKNQERASVEQVTAFFSPLTSQPHQKILSSVLLRRQRWQRRIDKRLKWKEAAGFAPEAKDFIPASLLWTSGIPLYLSAWERGGSWLGLSFVSPPLLLLCIRGLEENIQPSHHVSPDAAQSPFSLHLLVGVRNLETRVTHSVFFTAQGTAWLSTCVCVSVCTHARLQAQHVISKQMDEIWNS